MILICRFCNWEVSSSYKLQLPSAALSIPSSPSPRRHPHFSPRRHQEHQRHQEPLSVSLSVSATFSSPLYPQLPISPTTFSSPLYPSSPSPRRHPHFSPRRHQEHQRHQEPLSLSLSLCLSYSATFSSPLYPQLPKSPTPQVPNSPTPQVPKSPSPQVPNSPSPKSQVPSPGGPEAVDAVVPAGPRWCCTSSLVPTLLCCPTGSTG